MGENAISAQEIANREHIAPGKTGDNIAAKRVALYGYDSVNSAWSRSGTFLPNAYDYVSYTSGTTTDTYVFKSGGSSGTTVQTVVITYTDSSKAILANVART